MFECIRQGSVFVISGTDPLTKDHTATLSEVFDQCAGKGQPRIVLNLQGVPLLDSAGLELLLDLRDKCMHRGGLLQLAGPNVLCRDILQVTDLASQFALFDDVNSAVGSFSQ